MSVLRTRRPVPTAAPMPTPMTTSRPVLALSLLGVMLALGACASTSPPIGRGGGTDATGEAVHGSAHDPALGAAIPNEPASRTAPTLYDDIGGKAGVASLTERFIREIAADDRIRGHYRDSDMGRFYRMMQAQMCEVTGGGCTYEGDDMRRTHGGMNITPTEFNGIVEALMRAMDAEKLPVGVQNRILAIYAPMREDVIDH